MVGTPQRGASTCISKIQEYLRPPAAFMFLDREAMERNRLHVSALMMAGDPGRRAHALFVSSRQFPNRV